MSWDLTEIEEHSLPKNGAHRVNASATLNCGEQLFCTFASAESKGSRKAFWIAMFCDSRSTTRCVRDSTISAPDSGSDSPSVGKQCVKAVLRSAPHGSSAQENADAHLSTPFHAIAMACSWILMRRSLPESSRWRRE
jgi:hypothetical protein